MPRHHYRHHHHHHRHHGGDGAAVAGALIGGALIGGAVAAAASRPRVPPPRVYQQPGMVVLGQPQPVVVQQPVIMQQPVVVQQPRPQQQMIQRPPAFGVALITVPSATISLAGWKCYFTLRVRAISGQEWTIEHRYRTVRHWWDDHVSRRPLVKANFPAGFPLPATTIVGTAFSGWKKDDVQQKRLQLESFLQQLCQVAAADPPLQTMVYKFVEFTKHAPYPRVPPPTNVTAVSASAAVSAPVAMAAPAAPVPQQPGVAVATPMPSNGTAATATAIPMQQATTSGPAVAVATAMPPPAFEAGPPPAMGSVAPPPPAMGIGATAL